MSETPSVDCDFGDSPLMLTLAQLSFTQSPEIIQNITNVKAGLADLGLLIAEEKQQASFTIAQAGAAPVVTQNRFWWFSDPDKVRAVAVAPNSVVLYDGNYERFGEFITRLTRLCDIIVSEAGPGCFLTTFALRYVSGFPSDGAPSPYLAPGLHGIDVNQLNTEHFHHQYGFWCDTDEGGRLVVNAKTLHGNQLVPQDIQSANISLDDKFTHEKEVDVVQLDLHETVQKKKMEVLATAEIERLAIAMRSNIKRAFLAATTPEGHRKWNITNSDLA